MPAIAILGWGALGVFIGHFTRRLTDRITRTQRTTPSIAPPLVFEAITAALFIAFAWRIGAKPQLLAYSWLATIGVPLAASDLAIGRLPNLLTLPSYPILIGLFGPAAAINHDAAAILRAVAAMAVLLGFYLLLYAAAPGQLGGGDVKLSGLLGLALGWASWSTMLTGTLLGWLLAAITHTAVQSVARSTRNQPVRLGPFLIAGAVVALLMTGSD